MFSNSRYTTRGFTLIELVVVITLLGVFAATFTLVIVEPFEAADDQTRRARLTDQADLIINRVRREVRSALPNSVRVDSDGDRTAVEFVPTITGGRYRRLPASGGVSDTLNRTQDRDTFDVLGRMPKITEINTGGGGIDCATNDDDCINIFNTGQTDFDIYEGDNIAEIIRVINDGAPFDDDKLEYENDGSTPAFEAHSPNQRFFVFRDVVSFVCDRGDDQLLRYATYGLESNQPVQNSDPGFDTVTSDLVADDLDTCAFSYNAGAATRQGLLTIEIGLTRGGETVELLGQIHVVNAP